MVSSPVVSAEWLADRLDESEVAIADCCFTLADPNLGRQQYERGHIRGAYYLDLDRDLSAPARRHGGRHPLPDLQKLGATLAAIGIDFGKTMVVAYDDSSTAFAARLWWLLRYCGHDRVAVLDGGWSGWQAGGYPTSTEIPSPQSGNFIPQVRSDWIVGIEGVRQRQNLPEVALIDSRSPDRYRGEREPIDPIAGCIPGAVNFPWQDVCDPQGYLHSSSEQQQRWQALQGKQELILYCGSGVTACTNLLSLAIAGVETAKLYPGGWSDWCSYL